MDRTEPELESLLVPGSLLDHRYRVERTLGRGGMGIVVAAIDTMDNSAIAIKVLCPRHANTRAGLPRFRREAQVAHELGGEGVPRVLGGGRDERGLHYLVMDRLEGEDMEGLLGRSPRGIPLAEAAQLIGQACQALERIHAAGVVHRDLKPSNLFLARQPDGSQRVKILDFGISKLHGTTQPGTSLTQATDIMGSPSYMSPEQVQTPRLVDHRTDIWSLGSVLYELLTGRLAFSGNTAAALFVAVMTSQPVPATKIRPDLPAEVDEIINRCLAKDLAARYQGIAELGAALLRFELATPVRQEKCPTGPQRVSPQATTLSAKGPEAEQERWLLEALENRFSSPGYRPPRLPVTAMRLLELSRKPDVTLRAMVALMQEDQFLSAEVVRLAESSAYGGVRVRTLEDALTRLGLRRAADAFLSAAMHLRVFRAPGFQEPMDRLRRHCVLVAHLARLVSRQTTLFDEHAFLCGLLHDIGLAAGMLVLADVERGTPLPSFEVAWPAIFHVHEKSGARVVRLWGLPEEIALAIEHHHDPRVGGRLHPTGAVIAVADWISTNVGGDFDAVDAEVARASAEGLGISPQQMDNLMRSAEGIADSIT